MYRYDGSRQHVSDCLNHVSWTYHTHRVKLNENFVSRKKLVLCIMLAFSEYPPVCKYPRLKFSCREGKTYIHSQLLYHTSSIHLYTQCCSWVPTSSSGVWDSEWCGDTHWSRHQWERGLWSLSLSTHHHTTQPCLWSGQEEEIARNNTLKPSP